MVLTKSYATYVRITHHGAVPQAVMGTLPDYRLRISTRAKHARIVVRANSSVEVVLPLGATESEAQVLMQQQQGWVERMLLRMRRHLNSAAPVQVMCPESIMLEASLEHIVVCYADHKADQSKWHEVDGQLQLYGSAEEMPALLKNWLKKKAKPYLTERLALMAEVMGESYQKVSIRTQKTRWGSCSGQRNISLNAKLLLLPQELVDYVLIHELAHLKYMHHGPQFWQHVSCFVPDYLDKRQRLRVLSLSLPAWLQL
ncbi:MAG: SprT family zinc-dependent metalloprotease [Mariprofundaceae bacterium]